MHFSFPLQFFLDLTFRECILAKMKSKQEKYVKLVLAALFFNTAYNHSENTTGKILMKKELRKLNSHVGFILESCSQIIAHLHNRLGLLICLEEFSYVTLLHPPNYNYSHSDKKIFAYLNVPFSIASGKLMDQINYILKKIN